MINVNDLKIGQSIKFNNHLYQVITCLHVKPGKGAAFVRCKLKNLRTLSIIDYNFNAGIKLELAFINTKKMQFLYVDDPKYIFIDSINYEQIEIDKLILKNNIKFLYEGLSLDVIFYNNNEILGISLPDKLSFTVLETSSIVKTDIKSNSFKDAILENGLVIKVPMFIQQGEKIIVNTQTGLYVSRNNK